MYVKKCPVRNVSDGTVTFEIMDVKKCPVRRDGNLVSDGTINDTCVHLPVFYALINGMYIIPAHVTGWGLHPCT